jgi:uncharacterized protein (TIRG00374 family)
MRKVLFKIIPWIITVVALYFAFKGVHLAELVEHLRAANPALLVVAFLLTASSYLLRSRRWQYLFIQPTLRFFDSAQVLILGFFMNNVLPARTGEFVRAHVGSKVSGESRTAVLATIVNERLADGLTLSLLFVVFSLHAGDAKLSHELLLVAYLFGFVGLGILAVLVFRRQVFDIIDRLHQRFHNRATTYVASRLNIFINGLAPLFSPRRLPAVVLSSLAIWSIELAVYVAISQAYDAALPISGCVLFLVAVNFSSLIPAAPGGIGVIEAVTTAALVSVGVEKSHALAMVLTQHMFQYLIVGIPGALVMLTWKGKIPASETDSGSSKILEQQSSSEISRGIAR